MIGDPEDNFEDCIISLNEPARVRSPAPLPEFPSLKDWRRFRQEFEAYNKDACRRYLNYHGIPRDEDDQVEQIVPFMGEKWEEVYKVFSLKKLETTLAQALDRFECYFKNIMVSTLEFHARRQGFGEKFDDFFDDIKRQAILCGFGDYKNRALLDKIVVGVYDKLAQKQLLSTEDLTLDIALMICRFAETYAKGNRDEGRF